MRTWLRRLVVGLTTLAVWVLGMLGAYSYGQDYNLHRGFATLVQLPRAGTGRLLDVRFYSAALHRMAGYTVYLPPGYSAANRYPVYYLLHGMPGQPHVFVTIANMDVRLDNQLSLGTVQPMILVYPDGRIGGDIQSDSEWANTRAGSFESYVMDVVHNVDQRFSTLPLRQDRVIGGFSAGAYGALNIALHHLSDFASVQVWSGYFSQSRSGVFAGASGAALGYNSPIEYVHRVAGELRARGLRVFMFVGRDDSASSQLLPMVKALRSRGATVHYAIYPGGHDWSVWFPRLNEMLILASRDMGRLPPHGLRAAALARALARPHGALVRHHGAARRARRIQYVTSGAGRGRHHVIGHRPTLLMLIGALVLALVSAALINLGFVLQHRGLVGSAQAGRGAVSGAVRSPSWIGGQAIGWLGFAGQILAVALAPLTLVQAFAAGGLAISVPLAARIFGYRVGRTQLIAVMVVGASLFALPIGFAAGHGSVRNGPLIAAALLTLGVAGSVARLRWDMTRALAAGTFYGVADAAIKAGAVAVRAHGAGALVSGWTILAAAGTFGGFLSLQSALRRGQAVKAITLMNASTALTAVGFGLFAFGESLGTNRATAVIHALAIAAVLGCVWPLAAGQQQLTPGTGGGGLESVAEPRRRVLGRLLSGFGGISAAVAVLLSSAVGIGLLYSLRQLGWLAFGPRIPDALPLLQLAGFDGQPLARVAAAWLATGVALGVVLIRLRLTSRVLLVGVLGALTLLFASDACFALARNLRLESVLLGRAPALGAWLEGLFLVLGCALPAQTTALLLRNRRLVSHRYTLNGNSRSGPGSARVIPAAMATNVSN